MSNRSVAGEDYGIFSRSINSDVGIEQHADTASVWPCEEPQLADDFDPEPPKAAGKPKPENRGGFNFKTLRELMDEPEVPDDWLLDGLLVQGTVGLIAGAPKAGKSVLARGLALAVAQGRPFLDRATNQGSVFYLCLEERQQDVRRDFKQMGATGDEPLEIAETATPGISGLCAEILKRKPALAVIDPMQRLARIENGNDYGQTYAALSPLIETARETGCHILLLHHTAKVAREAVASPLGSTGLSAAVASILVLRRHGARRSLETVQRIGRPLEPTLLSFDEKTKSLSLLGSVAEAVGSRASEMILELLARQGELTQGEIRTGCHGIGTQHVRAALTTLLREVKIQSSGSGKRGDAHRYSLPPKGGFGGFADSASPHARPETGNSAEGGFGGFAGFSDTPNPHVKPENQKLIEGKNDVGEEAPKGGFESYLSIVKPENQKTGNALQPCTDVDEKVVSDSKVVSQNQKPDSAPESKPEGTVSLLPTNRSFVAEGEL